MNANELFPIVKKISEEKNYEFNPGVPVLKNKNELKQIIDLINEKNEKIIITEENLKDYTGKNNILSQMRKIYNELKSTKTTIHREAKKAYQPFDDEVDFLMNELDKSIKNLSEQVDYFQKQKKEEKIKKVTQTFNELSQEFINNQLDDDVFYHPKMLSFEMWFDNKKINLSQKKLVEDIKGYLINQTKDFETFYEFASENNTLKKLFIKSYELNNNASEAFQVAKTQKKEMDELYEIEQIKKAEEERKQQEELERIKKENEELKKQQQTNQLNQNKENNKVEKKKDKTYFAFIVDDISNAKLVKQFCEENNINYVMDKLS